MNTTAPASPAPRSSRAGAALYLGTLVLALGLTACANMSGISTSAQLRTGASLGLPSAATGTPDLFADAAIPDAWWQAFGDQQLDQLVGQALQGSPSLQLAQDRVTRAQAVTEAVHASQGPRVDGGLEVDHQRFSNNFIYPPPLGGAVWDSGTARISGSWERSRSIRRR